MIIVHVDAVEVEEEVRGIHVVEITGKLEPLSKRSWKTSIAFVLLSQVL